MKRKYALIAGLVAILLWFFFSGCLELSLIGPDLSNSGDNTSTNTNEQPTPTPTPTPTPSPTPPN